jgi:MFS family permease
MNPPPSSEVQTAVAPPDSSDLEALYDKIAWRIMPFLVLLFVVAWLDRINIGFARLQMVKDLGFTDTVYGFGAGIFYLGYLLFEVPSNLVLERIGARKTFTRITILWGLTSIAMVLVKTAMSYYVLRFLLGTFEAGLLPGAILYLTYWFPARRRAQMVGLFLTAIPIAGILGGPLSGWIMSSMTGRMRLANWQWLFLLEGIPSIVMGLLTFKVFTDEPSHARWLTDNEKRRVIADLDADRRAAGHRHHGFREALKLPQVWLLTGIQFCLTSANPTFGFWTPTIIEGLGVRSSLAIGWLSAVPNIAAVICLIAVGRHSDRTLERRYHSALLCLVSAAGLAMIGVMANHPAYAFSVSSWNDGRGQCQCPSAVHPCCGGGGHRAHQLDWQFLGLGRAICHGWLKDDRSNINRALSWRDSKSLRRFDRASCRVRLATDGRLNQCRDAAGLRHDTDPASTTFSGCTPSCRRSNRRSMARTPCGRRLRRCCTPTRAPALQRYSDAE